MKFLKNVWSQLHRFVFWALILSIFWCWIFTFLADTSREKKVMVYVDAYTLDWRGLSVRLEEEGLPEGIKMIQVRSFDYDIFGSTLFGDVYIMRESILRATLEESPEKLAPLTLGAGETGYQWQGQTWGILVFDPATQRGPAMDYVGYAPETCPEPEAYYLCFDAAALHLATNPQAQDNAAWEVASHFLSLP